MTDTARFLPPPGLRNPHVQGLVSRLPARRRRILRDAAALLAHNRSLLLHGGEGQLLAYVSRHGDHASQPRPLVALLHGWEGSSDSLYLLATAASLFNAGYDVLRVNFRDHGDSHHLNEELFHSCRERELVLALQDALDRLQPPALALAGFSLGGSFALRVAPSLPVRAVAAICPVRFPPATLTALETGPALYRHYFLRKWRQSLRRKAGVFPDRYADLDWRALPTLTAMTDHFVRAHTGFGTLERYLHGYALSDARLAELRCATRIIIARDDPVIPAADWLQAPLPPQATLEISDYGGHCGFVSNWQLDGWIETRLRDWLASQLPR